jgi:hypothetical protein
MFARRHAARSIPPPVRLSIQPRAPAPENVWRRLQWTVTTSGTDARRAAASAIGSTARSSPRCAWTMSARPASLSAATLAGPL